MFSSAMLTGKVRDHIKQYVNPRFDLSPVVAQAYFRLAEKARSCGINPVPFSSFRDFDSQLRIWQYKSQGKRPILTQEGVLDINQASEEEIIHGILRWSALPGASRHHWGTEIDIVDAAVVEKGYKVQLIPQEYEKGGVFYDLAQFLETEMASFGFFRPYAIDKGGVNCEPWHISFISLAEEAQSLLDINVIYETISKTELFGKSWLLANLDLIYTKYITNITAP